MNKFTLETDISEQNKKVFKELFGGPLLPEQESDSQLKGVTEEQAVKEADP